MQDAISLRPGSRGGRSRERCARTGRRVGGGRRGSVWSSGTRSPRFRQSPRQRMQGGRHTRPVLHQPPSTRGCVSRLGPKESTVGAPLFARSSTGVVPAARGRALYAEVAAALDQLEVVLSGPDAEGSSTGTSPSGSDPQRSTSRHRSFPASAPDLRAGAIVEIKSGCRA